METAAACAGACFLSPEILGGAVHSAYRGAVNLLFRLPDGEERMFTLLPPGSPLLPDCAASPPFFWRREAPRAGTPCALSGGVLSLEGEPAFRLLPVSVPEIVFRGPAPSRGFEEALRIFAETGTRSAIPALPEKFRAALESFCGALLSGDAEKALAGFASVSGAGIGLTPSCDDAVIGMEAMRRACRPRSGDSGDPLAAALLGALLSGPRLTTRVSEKYLKCAFRGMFSPALARLAQSCAEENCAGRFRDLEEIARTGHTSGADTLYGVRLFALAAQESQTIRKG